MALPARIVRNADPFVDLENMLLGRFLGQREAEGNWMAPYAVDIHEDTDHIFVEAELPGFKKNEVEITLENQTLTISAERNTETRETSGSLLHERRYSRFLRSFTLPMSVSDQKVDAKLCDGILTITLNKREETKPKKIEVN